jgi:hypothetical protein
MLFTLQFTAFELAPVTVAMNCTVRPSKTDALCGETLTLTFPGSSADDPVVNAHPQAASIRQALATASPIGDFRLLGHVTDNTLLPDSAAPHELGRRKAIVRASRKTQELFHYSAPPPSWASAPH